MSVATPRTLAPPPALDRSAGEQPTRKSIPPQIPTPLGRSPLEHRGLVVVLICINLYYAYALSFGFASDDFTLLRLGFGDAAKNCMSSYFRPLWWFSYPTVSLISSSALAHRLVNLLLLNGCMILSYSAFASTPYRVLTLLALFLHPSFIFPVTWIAQRNDLILLVFLLLTWKNLAHSRTATRYALVADLAKSPFVLHNFVVAALVGRRKRYIAAASLCLVALAVLAIDYFTIYATVQAKGSGLGRLAASGMVPLLFTAAARAVKAVENIFLVFVPFPATYGSPLMWAALIFYSVFGLWFLQRLVLIWRQPGFWATHGKLLAFAFSVCVALAFAPGLRALAPALPFCYLLLANTVSTRPLYSVACAMLILVNLAGSITLYRYSDTGAYDATGEMAYPNDVPALQWLRDRQEIVDSAVDRASSLL